MNGGFAQLVKLLILMLIPCSVLAEGVNNIGIGYEHTSGSYGTATDTEITTIPFIAQHADNAWRFRISVPYISVTGDGSVVPGSNGGSLDSAILRPVLHMPCCQNEAATCFMN